MLERWADSKEISRRGHATQAALGRCYLGQALIHVGEIDKRLATRRGLQGEMKEGHMTHETA